MQENITDLSLKNLNFNEIKNVFNEATKTRKIELVKFVLKKIEDFMSNVNVENFSAQTIEDITGTNSSAIKIFLDTFPNQITAKFELNLKALRISEVTSIPEKEIIALLQFEGREYFEELLSMFFEIENILDGKTIQKASEEKKMRIAKILSKFYDKHSNEISSNDLSSVFRMSKASIKNYIGAVFFEKCSKNKKCPYREQLNIKPKDPL
ncbi:MAG: hypothetical protein KAI67_05665 [Candidatus Pacebacteria bacterium]|nr:hypothetical protein [Candidatus Paceibacterota bacterium]